ncbi:MAG: LapA family protein [Rhodospirillales bacterium]|nr:LapA family protein [Rhodospirillales bacterium]MCB9964526.1 LapA family protein [Rhodospirillales bacterium]MCB9973799.1 LapA family protein [Rhodospirillales bacterium]MCB9980317.1 LapA family protein [Rhodospirillales bacterium]
MRFFHWIFSTLVALAAVMFAVSNMQAVEVYYNPLQPALSLPLAAIVLGAMGTGFLAGGVFIWCLYGPFSKRADKKRAQVYDLLKEVKDLKHEHDTEKQQAAISMPLLSSK